MKLSDWLKCKKYALNAGFSEEEIDNAVEAAGYTVDDLTDKEEFEKEPTYYVPRELVKDFHSGQIHFTEMSHRYAGTTMEGWRKATVQTWRIPAKYQGLKHEKFIRALLIARFPWFNDFEWAIYGWEYAEFHEIYLRVEGKKGRVLYVPVKCLVEKDIQGIIKRNTDYWNWYYDNNNPADRERMIATMDTEKAKEFFNLLENGEEGIEAIIFLQSMAGIVEPREKAKKGWELMSDKEREITLAMYRKLKE